MRRGHKRNGFTLLELLLVLALLAGIIALLHPLVFASGDAVRLRFAVEEVANEIRLAQSLAQSHGRNIGMNFRTDHLRMFYYDSGALVRPELYFPPGVRLLTPGKLTLVLTALGGVAAGADSSNLVWELEFLCGTERLYIVTAIISGRISVRSSPS